MDARAEKKSNYWRQAMSQCIHTTPSRSKEEVLEHIEALLTMLDDDYVVNNAEELKKVETEIAAATDKIAGIIIKTIIINSLIDKRVVDESKKIVKSCADRMKNHGKREVLIKPYRGEQFSVCTTYYYRAGLSSKKRLKKGVYFPN